MKNIDKLKELLEKSSLTPAEKESLNNIVNEDRDAGDYYEKYTKLKVVASAASHPSTDELGNYILYLNGMSPDNDVELNFSSIENHLKKCKKCSDEFNLLSTEYSDIKSFVGLRIRPLEEPDAKLPLRNSSKHSGYFSYLRYTIITLVLAGFLYGALYFFSQNFSSAYYKEAILQNEEQYITRGRSTEQFHESISALDMKDYEAAIDFLKKDIEKNSGDETIFYSHYILGLTYLETAPKSFAGLFPHFDKAQVNEGIKHLSASIDKNDSGKFKNIKLDAYFYLGKGYLMLENPIEAKKYFTVVLTEKGSKMSQAKMLLDELE
jgi:tetratricopeptide (TPR) repeat protein